MVELEKVLLNLVKPMVEDPNALEVRQMLSLNDNEIILYVYAKSEDVARLIGRQGSMASALRQMMSIASRIEDKKITIKFETLTI
ncbi:KH domain-containing protein [Anaerorhabdus sp.]|uniref:KH domain-containing protein n=1 Tax=bioreactor metagenome TaxID=1076179 RepID=A0A645DTK7_9ZZZZ|nr:KH domain-containing protein [Anaerorhabdus sp.]MEA4875120.1 KH domain-containing protein [Anaerorhabdus sp.]